jgi:hypothetical protein
VKRGKRGKRGKNLPPPKVFADDQPSTPKAFGVNQIHMSKNAPSPVLRRDRAAFVQPDKRRRHLAGYLLFAISFRNFQPELDA